LFLVEYDFIVVYKPNGTHVVIDSLSRLLDIIEPTSVLDQAINAIFFNVESKWLKDVKEFLKIGHVEGMLLIQQKQRLVKRAKPLTLKNDELYRMGQDNRLWRYLTTIETQMVMRELHECSRRAFCN